VLIDKVRHDKHMEIMLLILLLIVGPLAVLAGADSRPQDTRDSSRWFPASR
jgi:hypothetical protein